MPHIKRWLARKSLSSLIVAAAFAVCGGAAMAADPLAIGIGYSTPLSGPHGAGAKAFEQEINRLAPGRFKIAQFPGGSLGGEREMVESLQLGTLQMAIVGTAIVGNFVPDMMVMDMPFLFRDSAHARATLDGPIGKEILTKFSARGLVGLTFGEIGFRHITASKRSIRSVDDLKGLKIRTMENPVHLAAFRALGAQPTPMAWTEVSTALQQGTIDGQENPMSVLVSSKLWETQKNVTLSRHVFTPIVFVMSPSFFDKLPAADREVMRKAADAGRAANRAYVDEAERTGVDELRKHGMQVITEIDTTEFQRRLEPVFAQQGAKFGDLIPRIKAQK